MQTVVQFECAFLADGVRHVASFSLAEAKADVESVMLSAAGEAHESQAESDYHVRLDLTAWQLSETDGDSVWAIGYVFADPSFLDGYSGTVEERCLEIGEYWRAFLTSSFACGPVEYRAE